MHAPNKFIPHIRLPEELRAILEAAPNVTWYEKAEDLLQASCGGVDHDYCEVAYDVPGKGPAGGSQVVIEATVARVRNGIVANYPEPYMRRRDPDCMFIADDQPTNKVKFKDRFGYEFSKLRDETFEWLKTQDLAAFAFVAGRAALGIDAVVVAPANAGFFAYSLALLQGITPLSELSADFDPQAIIYVAPPFRHTHFQGKQVVVHNRTKERHELFAYNLYPGPSAKKGIYGMLINLGEQEGWVTAHCSTVQVVTPYDNVVTIMHEGASGGGKSEMLEQVHREPDGRLLLGRNILSNERRHLEIPRACELRPVTDDMAMCHSSLQTASGGKLSLVDAEDAWFVRVNHLTGYGMDPALEKLTSKPSEPLVFLSIDAVPGSRALLWEHIEDAPGKPCPNPRVIVPRKIVPNVVTEPVTVDIRSFGVRTPPCTRETPSYGILGIFHVLPPALAWLWRLASPRGHANPSIVDTAGMGSEGVGSYWPFATGRRVDQANLLLRQFENTRKTRYILCPNQHVGAWECGFMPQWIAREYLARRGNAKFKSDQIQAARCPLLGYSIFQLSVEGRQIPRWFLQVESQPEVGVEAYDKGAEILYGFFRDQLKKFADPDLSPLGKQIIECCLSNGSAEEYERLLPSE
ncbi:MAG: hypothetical protein QOF78_853 [Phycisphaerales bacterium]|jgi:hypothetical protein|nr:hypothetical protein [Phycisphaerales bacterium]